MGDPLKRKSFTSRGSNHFPGGKKTSLDFLHVGLLRKLLSASRFKGKRRDSAELRRRFTSCFLLLPWMQNSVETQETEQAQETDLHSSSVPPSSASCPWLQETELRTENSFPPCPMDPPPSRDPRTDACCRPHCAGLPPGLLHANTTNSARPGMLQLYGKSVPEDLQKFSPFPDSHNQNRQKWALASPLHQDFKLRPPFFLLVR